MKKLLFAFTFSSLLAIFLLGSASANGGPHGSFSASTDSCAGCHRAHSAKTNTLLLSPEPELCLTCHGSAAVGSALNVSDGKFLGAGGGDLLSGGFVAYKGQPTTSSHRADGNWRNMWGSGGVGGECIGCHGDPPTYGNPIDPKIPVVFRSDPGHPGSSMNSQVQFDCTNCHDVHGGSNYRMLRYLDPADPASCVDFHISWYFVNSVCSVNVDSNEIGGSTPDQPGYVPDYTVSRYRSGMTDWCTLCHTNYKNTTDVASFWGGDPIQFPFDSFDGAGEIMRSRHKMDMTLGTLTTSLPLEQPTGYSATQQATDQVTCVTCHFAHGSNATMTGYAANVAPTNDSALLRLANRGVCQECHKK